MFNRFVQSGRVAFIADGPNRGKLCSIVDVIDPTRVLVDGPETGVQRGMLRINQLHLTKFRIKFPFTAPTRVVRKSWKDAKVAELWEKSNWARKLDSVAKRRSMNDFDRFKLRRAKRFRNHLRYKYYRKLVLHEKKDVRRSLKRRIAKKKAIREARVYRKDPENKAKLEAKKAAKAKKAGSKKVAPKKAQPKKDVAKKEGAKKEIKKVVKKDAPKKESPKKAESTKK